ncbi:LacI family DNA-binding transcriptional regulator [Halanaerobium congolense]|uniref:LacI family DNA-binding transcriptional regulator n=1 Tax=Halanaerobium congolense TaxID=54121 RepID=UPI00280B3F8E|nr:LacI family DNA-binding transcriptional regulator [Halanaerobium congolense]
MQITLKDIARMADVAESTVSRALNNKPGVGEDTKLKIIKIAKKTQLSSESTCKRFSSK